MPGARVMALVGRFGDGRPFLVGDAVIQTADREGTLFLTPNDLPRFRGDDRGAFRVTIDTGGSTTTVDVR